MIISQRPARLDETILTQCNSFLVLRLVNPKDKNFVRSVMENLSESDANILQTFGPGQGIVSGQAVRFPLLVKIMHDREYESTKIGDEDFLKAATDWDEKAARAKNRGAFTSQTNEVGANQSHNATQESANEEATTRRQGQAKPSRADLKFSAVSSKKKR
jgi:hypothetical protein